MLRELNTFFGTQLGENVALNWSNDIKLAAAVVALAAARADSDFAPSERIHLLSEIVNRFQLPAEKAQALLSEASERLESFNVERFLEFIKARLTAEERQLILAEVWAVILADGVVKNDESLFAVTIRQALGLSMEQSLYARKLAEGAKIDGFKELVEANLSVAEAVKARYAEKK